MENRSVARSARLLGLFSIERPELTLREIAAGAELNKATAHRYALALRRAGLLRCSPRGVYTLGPRVVELAGAALAGLQVVKLAGAHLERLVEQTGQTAVLSVWDGDSPVVVRVADSAERVVRIVVTTGTRLAPDSAQGRLFRAFLGDGDGESAELERVRREGLAHRTRDDGFAALAAPVFQGGRPAAALALVGTAVALDAHGDGLAQQLVAAAAAFSAELGFVPPDATRSDA